MAFRSSVDSKIDQARGAAGRAGDDMRDSAEQVYESGREFAQDSLGRISDKIQDLRRDLEPAMDQLRYRARRAARRGMDVASDARDRTREAVDHYSDVTGRYVTDQPVRSVLIAAAAGAALAALLIAARSRGNR